MSVINLFKSEYDNNHETIPVSGNKPIKDILPELEYTRSVISVNGFLVDKDYILEGGDVCTIRLFPEENTWQSAAAGGFIGALLGGPFWLVTGLIGAGIGAAANAITEAIGGHSILGGLNSLFNWLAPDIESNSPEQLKTIPQLRGAKNQSNRNKPIPLVLGRHLFTPMYIGTPYTEIGGTDGEDQYFNALYLLGWGKLAVSDIRLGPVSGLSKNSAGKTEGPLYYNDVPSFCDPSFADNNPRLELRQGPNPDREDGEVELYPQKVVEENLGIELMNVDGKVHIADRFSAKNPMKVQIEFTLNNGLISYTEKGKKQDAQVKISIQWKKPQENETQWKPFGQIGLKPDGTFNTGLSYSAPITTITRQKAKVMRFVAEKIFDYSEVVDATDRTIELRIFRTNSKETDPEKAGRTADTVYLTAIRTWCFDPDKSAEKGYSVRQAPMIDKYRDKTARLGFRIKATDTMQGTIDALNCIVQSYARVWNGTDWNGPEIPTNNPASVALKVLQSPALGNNAYPDKMLDMDSFKNFYNWCDKTITENGVSYKRFTCNGVLTAEKRVDDLLSAVLATGRAMRILNGDKYAILVDKPQDYPVLVLNSQNVLEASNQKGFEDPVDGLSAKFINEADGYQETEIYAMANGSNKPDDTSVIERIELPFVTNYSQAVKNCWYQLACKRLRPEVWSRKVSIEGYLIGIGDRVEVQDDTILVGLGEGAVIKGFTIENGLITVIHTDGVFDVTDTTKQYGIKIMQFDGVNPEKIRTIQVPIMKPGIYRDFTVAIPLDDAPPLPHEGDIISFGIYDKITTPAICFGKKDNGDGTFELTLIPYQQGIYDADSGIIPPYNANITTPQAMAPPGDMPPDPVSKSEILESLSEMDFTGDPATVYELRPGVFVIKREDDGSYTPDTISCGQVFIRGDELPETSHKTLTYITSENDTPESYTEPVPAGGWDWIEFILSDGDIELDRQRVPVLRNGLPATVYELLPSVSVVSRAQDGITLEPAEISCAQQMVTGTGTPVESDKTLRYATSAGGGEKNYSGPVTVDSDWEWIEFRLYDGDDLLDRERVLILYQYIPATVYELLPSVSVIKHKYDDTIEPASITCGQIQYTPGLPPSSSNKTIKYITSNDPDTETVYNNKTISINPVWEWIEFHLYEGSSLLDLERVPVIYDGADGIAAVVIDFSNDSKSIPCDETGNPYPGVFPFTNQATLYNATGGTVTWGLNNPPDGVTINQFGLITVAAGAVLSETNEIHVTAVWEGKTYAKNFNIVKVVDGSSPIYVSIDNDNKTVACDEDGIPLPGTLPFNTRAILYRGNTALLDFVTAPYYPVSGGNDLIDPMLGNLGQDIFPVTQVVTWSLRGAPPGVVINEQSGVITVEEGAELNDMDDITVAAIFEGNEYTDVFTLSKAYAGKSTIVLHIDDQDRGIMCYANGDVKQGILPMAIQPILYRGTGDISSAASWSLANAPNGVSITQDGLIIIMAGASLSMNNDITVKAVWRGETYTTLLRLGKVLDGQSIKGDQGEQGSAAPHYRGKAINPPDPSWPPGQIVIQVNATTPQIIMMMPDDWVAYVGASSGIWVNGYCMRWDGDDWGTVSPTDETALYMEALMDLTEGAPLGTFTAVFCRTIAAQQAFINELQTKLIQVQNAIFGGARFVRNGDGSGVVDLGDDKTGFKLGADGQLIASGADISGTINANNGSFSNLDIKDVTISGNSVFKGDIISGPLELTSDYYISDIINYPDNSINEQYLVLSELSRFGIPNTNREYHSFNISGTYNGTTISRIMYHYDTVGGTDVRAWDTSMNLLTIKFGMSAAVGYNIIGDLSFRYTSDGKTFKLKSLPGQQGASGAVYKDANNFLRITP